MRRSKRIRNAKDQIEPQLSPSSGDDYESADELNNTVTDNQSAAMEQVVHEQAEAIRALNARMEVMMEMLEGEKAARKKECEERTVLEQQLRTVREQAQLLASNNTNPAVQSSDFPADATTASSLSTNNINHAAATHSLSARTTIERRTLHDLPKFSGRPEEWPMFVEDFRSTTEAFQYTDLENMMRLKKSLFGKARVTVECLMIYSQNVGKVIDTLSKQYGRPDQLVRSQIESVRSLAPVTERNIEELVPFAEKVMNMSVFLDCEATKHHLCNPTLLDELADKLPMNRRLDWACTAAKIQPYPTIKHFAEWVDELAQLVSRMVKQPAADQRPKPTSSSYRRSLSGPPSDRHPGKNDVCLVTNPKSNTNDRFRCKLCSNESHTLKDCPDFVRMSVDERWTEVKQRSLCFCCLRSGHMVPNCQKKVRCGVNECTRMHHPKLHATRSESITVPAAAAASNTDVVNAARPSSSDTIVVDTTRPSSSDRRCGVSSPMSVLFRIVPVTLYGPTKSVSTFAFIDDGSSVTLIDEAVADQLELPGEPYQQNLQWFDDRTSTKPSRRVNLRISGNGRANEMYNVHNAKTVRNINLAQQTIRLADLHTRCHQLKHLPIAEYVNAKPTILIGLDNGHLGIPRETVEYDNGPVAVNTRLGWLVYGKQPHRVDGGCSREIMMHCRETDADSMEEIQRIVKEYFTTENFGVMPIDRMLESRDDARARTLLEETTIRRGGSYETGLLWKSDETTLPDSRQMAVNRLLGVERRMRSDVTYAEMYTANMNDFVRKGYARKLSESELRATTPNVWYLPHFGVSNVNKPNKLRLVFDAAAAVDGTSLNSVLLTGPDQYKSLSNVLFQFRMGAVGVSGDIQEMFLQVKIKQSDQNAQRFLWRGGDTSQPIDTYVMQSMTFGARCSPCSAQFVKNTNALEYRADEPEAVDAIIEHHYVDDFVMSFGTPADAIRISQAVVRIHRHANFNLRGFKSNSREVLSALGVANESGTVDMQSEEMCEKILGMHWDTTDDVFIFKLNLHRIASDVVALVRKPSKRQLLSVTMSIFDPYGLLCNIMLYAKLLVQELWRIGCAWDDEVPESVNAKWAMWLSELRAISSCRVARCYSIHLRTSNKIELHVFADASESAFAAVAYWRVKRDDNGYDVAFIAGKTRCAPQKLLSVPRLELQAAVLATRLYNTVLAAHDQRVDAVYMWTDSSTVLTWICSDHRRYKKFVAARITEVLETTEESNWHWLPTAENVADDATRAKYPFAFDPKSRWIVGPEFLRRERSEWNVGRSQPTTTEPEEELRSHVNLSCRTAAKPWIDFARFSKYTRLRRTVAWILRFVHNAKKGERRNGELVPVEVIAAEMVLFRIAQSQGFATEYAMLGKQQPIEADSAIRQLLPHLDDNGVMRMFGRANAAAWLSSDAKKPILLPRDHELTWLVVSHYHQQQKHQNQEATICAVRMRFWVPKIRSLVKKVKGQCQFCKNMNAIPVAPIMGQLPEDRLTPHVRPFTYTGVDYFGPYTVTIGRRHEKRWVALFTCLTVRAVHLELAADLSTDAFIVCLRNFVNTRGAPARLRSDNGTNFIGASKVIRDVIGEIDNDAITRECTSRNIEWVFNSPAHPEAGGCWERMVKCVKRVLAVTMAESAPHVETFRCLLLEAANIVNSRPLTHVPVDPATEDPLTPNHFLLGHMNTQSDIDEVEHRRLCHLKQYRIAQQLKDCFWRRWVREYLPELTRRTKWHKEVPALTLGALVLVCDENLSRSKWRKGRVQDVFPGPDGRVRNATVRTTDGVLRRPASRLAILDVGESHAD